MNRNPSRSQSTESFDCLTISPIDWEHPGLAVAAARAGAVALLDAEFCRDTPHAVANYRQLERMAGSRARIGMRLRADQLASGSPLLEARPRWILLCRWADSPIDDVAAALRSLAVERLLIEVTQLDHLALLTESLPFYGLVAKGNESSGWVGEDSAFILTQKLISFERTGRDARRQGTPEHPVQPDGAAGSRAVYEENRPVYVQGGIGVFSTAACRVAGAAGVVLESQLLLMPESPLPSGWSRILSRLSVQDSAVVGHKLGDGCRIAAHPLLPAAVSLRQKAEQLELESAGNHVRQWREAARAHVGWGPPESYAWPVGQDVALSAAFRDRYKTTGRLVQAILAESLRTLQADHMAEALAPGGPLALAHGTKYPIVQGPMTRVSDTSEFAEAVAEAGGLPFVALAMFGQHQAGLLLRQVRERLGDRPWGVGILGFVPADLRRQQIAEILRVNPPFALIAGGQPEQALELESAGTRTYLHAPAPALLKIFLERGSRRFVFEGRECGGHVGPLSSFLLWETMIAALLENVPARELPDIHVLLAGGIQDARSAAMAMAMAAPLAARGCRVGILMGSAYLFTREAVASGAIMRGFQDLALACRRTVTLETGAGHAIRCIDTPFTREFEETRRQLLRENNSPAQVSATLEKLTLGRLRIASKGVARDEAGLVPAREDDQYRLGMYMIGQAGTLRSSVCAMQSLHDEVSRIGSELLAGAAAPECAEEPSGVRAPADIAIIGMAALLPGAPGIETYWDRLLRKTSAIREIPRDRWDWRLYYDPDPKAPDKISSKWGGFIDDVRFDPLRYGIPPKFLKAISPAQLMMLDVVRHALEDAGYESQGLDRKNTSVIFGTDGSGPLRFQYALRSFLPQYAAGLAEDARDRLPEWTEESFPGVLGNVSAGRVANRFDLGGANFTIDAACAASLMAIDVGINELASGRSNVVIAGGVDVAQSAFSYTAFSKTMALSPRGRVQAFDKAADGTVISEGIAVVVLKRLADAERDGDRIYAVIRGTGASSDGKGLGLTAPGSAGQQLAFERAYRQAGVRPGTLGYYEAHGTGTAVGDRTELETIVSILKADQAGVKSCAVGSVKNLIGHTKTCAGVAGLIKTALALHHKVLPPHAEVEAPLEALADPASPVCLHREPRPWLAHPDHPRRAGVSAFGFGGTNAHAVLEEYEGAFPPPVCGAARWPCELLVLKARDRRELGGLIRTMLDSLPPGREILLRDLAYSCSRHAQQRAGQTSCLAVIAASVDQFRDALRLTLNRLDRESSGLPPDIMLSEEAGAPPGPVAFLFPGQGSQYPGMARESALYLSEMRQAIEFADRFLRESFEGNPISRWIYPPGAFSQTDRDRDHEDLADTRVAQPAIGTISLGFLAIAARLGLRADMTGGHSYGELTALHAAGALSREDFLRLSEVRGRAMRLAREPEGAMASLHASAREVREALAGNPDVWIANYNGPRQVVISGEKGAVRRRIEAFAAAGIRAALLPVSGAFHSPLMIPALEPLQSSARACAWRSPRIPVYSNVTAKAYPSDADGVGHQIVQHLLNPVRFSEQIEQMYADGARVFVELGPKGVLTSLATAILGGKEHLAVSLDPAEGGLRGLLLSVGRLITRGVAIDVPALFEGRDARAAEWEQIGQLIRDEPLRPTDWMINGASARPHGEAAGFSGKKPPLTLEDVERRAAESQPAAARPFELPGIFDDPPVADRPASAGNAAQILAAYTSCQETMRQFLSMQERLMQRFLGGEADAGGAPGIRPPEEKSFSATPAPTSAATPAEAPLFVPPLAPGAPEAHKPAAGSAPDRDELTRTLLRLVSGHTGYPEEMLGLDADLEAEFGIDSIKRIEILDALRKTLRDRWPELVLNDLTSVKTLNHLVDAIAAHLPVLPDRVSGSPAVVETATVSEASPVPDRANETTDCPRYVFASIEDREVLPTPADPHGLYLVTEDGLGAGSLVAAELRQMGALVSIAPAGILASPLRIEEFVRTESSRHGPVRGIVHLAALTATPFPETLAQWKAQTQVQSKSLFHLLRAGAVNNPDERIERVLVASLFGGHFGRLGDCGPGIPAGGSGCGLLKSLQLEWPHLHCRALDFDDGLAPAEMSRRIVAELLSGGGDIEVGYPGGMRTRFQSVSAPLENAAARSLQPDSQWVVLATGGARGITAEIVRSLIVPGMRLAVVGRAPEPAGETSEFSSLQSVSALREAILRQARQENSAVTLREVEKRLQALLDNRDRRRNLDDFSRAGAVVEYHSIDVRKEDEFGALLRGLQQRHGRLDAIIHGAGIIDDKPIEHKDVQSFDNVFDTKVDSTYLLRRYVAPGVVKLLVLFGSVSGRFGNHSQTDYAAANEVMNRFGWRLKGEWPSARVVTINWGPWAQVGMARPGVLEQLRRRGINPIAPAAGSDFLTAEIGYGGAGEAEIVAGRGPWSLREMSEAVLEIDLEEIFLQISGLSDLALSA